MITQSPRNVFLGAHVTASVKEALRLEADKQDISMSELTHAILRRALRDLGYDTRTGKKLPKGQRENDASDQNVHRPNGQPTRPEA